MSVFVITSSGYVHDLPEDARGRYKGKIIVFKVRSGYV